MAYRPTSKEVSEVFEMFCRAIGKRVAKTWNDVGAWKMDHTREYGGYAVQEILDEKGSVTMPIGDERLKPTEFVERMRFALRWLEQKQSDETKEIKKEV